MTDIEFRHAVAVDLPAIVAVLADDDLGKHRESAGAPLHPDYEAAFKAIESDPNQLFAVAVQGGQIAGCLQLSFIPGLSRKGMWRGQIESVRIASHLRGAGLGGKLIEWAIGQCRQKGCGLVQLATDKKRPDALRFYESLDFKASHEGMKRELE